MSWQERIERHKQEQARLQNEAERKLREEQGRQRVENVEKIKPLLQVLEDLKCKEMLTQIKDEIWKFGEVTVSPKLDEVTHETPIKAQVVLSAKWPCYSSGYSEYVGPGIDPYDDEYRFIDHPHEDIKGEFFDITCFSREGDSKKQSAKFYCRVSGEEIEFISVEETHKRIEEVLVEYFAQPSRESPIDKRARDMEELEKWKKRQSSSVQTVRKVSLWERFINPLF